jgi:hypothetical protein
MAPGSALSKIITSSGLVVTTTAMMTQLSPRELPDHQLFSRFSATASSLTFREAAGGYLRSPSVGKAGNQ